MKIKIANIEAEITDLMVFIGPDDATKDLICREISAHWVREPENGLFPVKQNEKVFEIVEWINYHSSNCVLLTTHSPLTALNNLLLTTHSPYILTALNNLIYAYQVGQKKPDEVNALIPKRFWIDPRRISAYFVENGTARSIMDEELQHINAEEIDKASTLTNELYDKLLDIKVNGNDDDDE